MQVADARAVARVNLACWREAYPHVVSAAVLAAMDEDRATEGFTAMLDGTVAQPPTSAVLALAGPGHRDVVGFAVARPSRDEPPVRDVELWAIYVLSSHHGGGAGQLLLDAALGTAPASLWVWEDNPRAHSFYARNGFTADGARRVHEPWGPAPIVRLVR